LRVTDTSPSVTILPPVDPAADAFKPVEPARRSWLQWLPPMISVALAVAVIVSMRDQGLAGFLRAVPREPAFWLAFAGFYLTLPLSEWLIYRRLWGLPVTGIVPLLRKLVSNEILLGYSGEAVFYLWARTHSRIVTAPFGAIKDVSILSALAGNVMTLGMLAVVWQLLAELWPGGEAETLAWSAAAIVMMSMGILLFRARLFTLPRGSLLFIFTVHMVRLVVAMGLYGAMWHFALPQLDVTWLMAVATLKLVVDRLPFVPNKDLLFANVAIFLVGGQSEVGTAVAMIAGALIATHIVVGILLVAGDALGSIRK
jgi:hypothetical protein